MKTKFILQTFLLTIFVGVWSAYVFDVNAQGCTIEEAPNTPYVQDIINNTISDPGECFFTEQYILFEYNGEAYVRRVAGYNDGSTIDTPCPAPDIFDAFYDCSGDYICGFGFVGPPADPDFCNALVAASSSGTVIWSISGGGLGLAVQKPGNYTYSACIGETLSIPIQLMTPGPAQADPPCIDDGIFTFSGSLGASISDGVLSINVNGPGEVNYSLDGLSDCDSFSGDTWNITIEPTSDCEGFCIADDPFSVPLIQDIINDNNPCFAYSQIVELTYNSSTYFKVEQIIAPTYSPDTCPAPDIVNTAYYDCEGNYICGFGFTAPPTDPTLCDALVAAAPLGTVIWENDFGTGPPVSSAPIFLNNPWLANLIDENDCTEDVTVTVYELGVTQYFYVENAVSSTLYINGIYFCADTPNIDCVSSNNLTNVVDTWACGETSIPGMPCGVADPLTLDFIQPWFFLNDTASNATCLYMPEIVMFELDGYIFFRQLTVMDPSISTSDIGCEASELYLYFDCVGNELCAPWGSDPQELCDDLWDASQSGTVIYTYTPGEDPNPNPKTIQLTALLEGPYNTTTGLMETNLLNADLLPSIQPYNTGPWNYYGGETVSSFPTNAVDWVLVEARQGVANSAIANTTLVEQKAALLLSDGSIVAPNGGALIFQDLWEDAYYFSIRHRNHLDILSTTALTMDATVVYDFTTGTNQAFGAEQLKVMSDGKAVLYASDFNPNGIILNTDYDQWFVEPALNQVYHLTDANLDGVVQATDYDLWFANRSKLGSVEIQY